MCADVQVEALQRKKPIADQFSGEKPALSDVVLQLSDVAPVYEHLGSKTVGATTEPPPSGQRSVILLDHLRFLLYFRFILNE